MISIAFCQVYFRQGQTQSTPIGTSWLFVLGQLTQLEAGPGGEVWGVTPTGGIQSRLGVSAINPNGTSWQDEKPSGYQHVAIGKSGVFAITVNGIVEYCKCIVESFYVKCDILQFLLGK